MGAYIQHHGVKGQRWGVRRYQNADGSLTPSGKMHYKSVGEAVRTIGDARQAKTDADRELLKARGRQIKTFGRAITTSFSKDGSKHTKALRDYRRETAKAHKAYAKSVDALANYNASKALTKRGAIRKRQNTYQSFIQLTAFSLTQNGKKQYAQIVKVSETANGKSITDDLVRRGKTRAYIDTIGQVAIRQVL